MPLCDALVRVRACVVVAVCVWLRSLCVSCGVRNVGRANKCHEAMESVKACLENPMLEKSSCAHLLQAMFDCGRAHGAEYVAALRRVYTHHGLPPSPLRVWLLPRSPPQLRVDGWPPGGTCQR